MSGIAEITGKMTEKKDNVGNTNIFYHKGYSFGMFIVFSKCSMKF